MLAVEVQNLGKLYKLYRRPEHRLLEALIPGLRLHRKLWAIRRISFQLRSGESLAIIGPNGAGKSTLLRILAGACRPTEGLFRLRGRVGAVLELGLGFAPSLTGRQNIKLAGLLMGLRPEEIEERIPDIAAFSELGTYLDRPVREYSSGMRSRLGFSIASHLDVDVLLADEALSAGDNLFRIRASERVRQLLDRGTTLLYATHSARRAQELCAKAIWIEYGRVMDFGEVGEVVRAYMARGKSVLVRDQRLEEGNGYRVPVTIVHAQPVDADGQPLEKVPPATPLVVALVLYASEPVGNLDVICELLGPATRCLTRLTRYNSAGLELGLGFHRIEVRMNSPRAGGSYDLIVRLARSNQVFGDRVFETRVLPGAVVVLAPEQGDDAEDADLHPFSCEPATERELAALVPSHLNLADDSTRSWLRSGWQYARDEVRLVGAAEFFLFVPQEADTLHVRCRGLSSRRRLEAHDAEGERVPLRASGRASGGTIDLFGPIPERWRGRPLLLRLVVADDKGAVLLRQGEEVQVIEIAACTDAARVQKAHAA